MRDGLVGAAAVGVGGVLDGVGVSPADLPRAPSSAGRLLHLITTVATMVGDPTTAVRIMRIPVTTLNHTRAAAEGSNTACNVSGATIQTPERIWATTAVAIRVPRATGWQTKTPA